MALYPVKCAVSLPCKNLGIDDNGKALSWGAGDDAGSLVESTANSRVAGKCEVVDKNLDQCTLEYAGVVRFRVDDTVTLAAADLGKGILGAADGNVTPTAYSSTYNEDLRGSIVAWSNTTGDKYVDVVFVGG